MKFRKLQKKFLESPGMVNEIVSFVVSKVYFSKHLVSSKLVSHTKKRAFCRLDIETIFQREVQLSNFSSFEAPTVPEILKGFCASLSLFVLIKFVLVKSRLLAI